MRLPAPADTGYGGSGMGGMDWNNFAQGAGSFFGGLFSNSDAPYDAAMNQYREWGQKAQDVQNPYMQAGQQAIPQYQQWLQGQQNPSGFINNLMGQYQESPYAHYMQQQSIRAGQNAASASGLIGSTPFAQALQQNASNISSQDMNQWLQNVLGINTQYGQGQQNLIGTGQNSANALTNMYGNMGNNMASAMYNKENSRNNNQSNMFSGIAQMGVSALPFLL